MKTYCVQMIEEYRQDMLIEADNPEQAREFVADGAGIEGKLRYSHTIEPEEWLVFEQPEK